MTRETAFALASSIADAGFSATASLSVHRDHLPEEHCLVTVHALRVSAAEIRTLAEIGERFDCDMHLITGDGLTFFERPKPAVARPTPTKKVARGR